MKSSPREISAYRKKNPKNAEPAFPARLSNLEPPGPLRNAADHLLGDMNTNQEMSLAGGAKQSLLINWKVGNK